MSRAAEALPAIVEYCREDTGRDDYLWRLLHLGEVCACACAWRCA